MPVPSTNENLDKCLCRGCPTHNGCMTEKNELLFCANGKSNCKVELDECLCEGCPVDIQYKLTANLDLMERMILKLNKFYCENGPAK